MHMADIPPLSPLSPVAFSGLHLSLAKDGQPKTHQESAYEHGERHLCHFRLRSHLHTPIDGWNRATHNPISVCWFDATAIVIAKSTLPVMGTPTLYVSPLPSPPASLCCLLCGAS